MPPTVKALRRATCRTYGIIALASLCLAPQAAAQGMLDDVPEGKGVQKITPESLAPSPKAETPPSQKEERLVLPERPSSNFNFLEGCWVSDTFRHSPTDPISTSTYCFNAKGQGTLLFQNGRTTCRLAARASYEKGLLRMSDTDGPCTDGTPWYADFLDCERGTDGVAACRGRSKMEGRIYKWTVTFRKKGGASR